jgi:hypothetical protein
MTFKSIFWRGLMLSAVVWCAVPNRGAASTDLALVEQFLQVVAQSPLLDLPREASSDGIVTPLSKTIARKDGLTLGVVGQGLRWATERQVREIFASHADRFLARALLRLPQRTPQSPEAPGLIEYRVQRTDGVVFLLAWRSDQPFAATASHATDVDLCTQLLPPFDAGPVPQQAPEGLSRRQVYARSFEGRTYERTTTWLLQRAAASATLQWTVSRDECNAG